MAAKVKAKPDGYHSVTPYLIVRNATEMLDFYREHLASGGAGVVAVRQETLY